MVKGIPDGMSKADLTAKLAANGYDVSKLGEPQGGSGRGTINPELPQPSRGGQASALLQMPAATQNYNPSDALTGAKKSVADTVRGAGLAEPMLPDLQRQPGYMDTIDQEYKDAGKGAGVTKFITDAAMVAAPATKAGQVARSAIKEAPNFLGRTLGRAVEGATSGAVAGATLAPGEGESRLKNAVKGAATGGILAPGLGAVGEGLLAGKDFITQPAATRAANMFKKGDVNIPAVSAELQNPVSLPMSTAAQAGSPELAAFEKTARGADQGTRGARWEKLDDATNQKAWEQTGDVLGDSIANLQPRLDAVKMAMKPAQDALNKIKFKADDKDSLILQIEQLRRSPNFASDSQGQQQLNRVLADATGPDVTLGSLANLDTELAYGSTKYNLNDRQLGEVRDRIRAMIDSRSNGAWSKAHADLAAARGPAENSESANAIYNAFSDPFSGARGKTSTGLPQTTSTKLNNAMAARGTDKTDINAPRDLLDPSDRQGLESIIDSLRKAEYPKTSTVPAAHMPGLSEPGAPLPSGKAAARYVANKLLGARSKATRDAASDALSGRAGWDAMVDAAQKSADISASDAAMLARILRGVGPVSGAAVTGER